MTMAMPPCSARPTLMRCRPCRTVRPRPVPPTSDPNTTSDSAIMIVWLTPTMMDGRATGSCTFDSSWRGVDPTDAPTSRSTCGTVRTPRAVRRTAGGMA